MIKKTMDHTKKYLHEITTHAVWAIAWGGVFISLYYSEVVGLPPCNLCWWQRILLYPLAILTTVAIIKNEYKQIAYYVLPFGILGMIASFYHSLLQWGIVKENVLDCSASAGVSCSDPEILFWVITIPFGSFLAFSGITLLSLASIYAPRFLLKDVSK